MEGCSNGVVISLPENDPGLVEDCVTLLEALPVLVGDGTAPNWSADRPIEEWTGITVGGTPRRVTALKAYGFDLSGSVPSVLGQLEKLQELDLDNEGLAGEIPPELGQLGNLRVLWLRSNELTGQIPPELGQLSNLEELGLSGNRLTGNIPAELGQLGKLEYLLLNGNQLSGSIPPGLGMLSSLRFLGLHENELSGPIPAEFGRLSNLRELHLRDNQLTGEIPPELEPLRNLSTLDLRNNDLSGSIPAAYAGRRYGSFGSLYLSGNELTGCIPLEVGGSLRDRHKLGLSYCQCPASWYRPYGGEPEVTFGGDGIPYMPHLSTERAGTYRITFSLVVDLPAGGDFSLDDMRRTDTGRIVVDIDEEKSWSSLTIDPFTGEELGRMVLEGPAGCGATVSGLFDQIVASARARPIEIPARPNGLQTMYRLQPVEGGRSYYLGYSNYLVVDVPEGMLLTLEDASLVCANPGGCWWWLELRDEKSGSSIFVASDDGYVRPGTNVEDDTGRDNNAFFDDLIASIRRVPPPHEEASCDMPPTAADCATLVKARDTLAGDATLNWSLDTPLWQWDGVRVDPWTGRVVEVKLQVEDLSGRIPLALSDLAALEVLKLSSNELTGGIPPELGRLVNLRELHIGWNRLGGEIPPELGALTSLVKLSLYKSQLTGGIPPELGRLVNLQTLDLGSNPLGGEIPPEVGSLTSLVELNLYDSQLTGGIPPELGQLMNLQTLDLGSNPLGGQIPPELGALASLVELKLANSQLTGGIPPELGRLANLQELYLGANPLGGQIPPELGALASLMELSLGANELVGEIPEELGRLTLLRYLSIRGNYLQGCIPKALLRFDIQTGESSNPDLRRCDGEQ